MQRANLIKLIHVARRELALDDDTYRVMIGRVVPGKTSCRDLKPAELERVLQAMQEQGFKRRQPSRTVPAGVTDKIRVIWRIMHREGHVTDGSDKALDAFVQRTTRVKNGGAGVARLAWLRGDQASVVLESLKRWHMRCMLERLPDTGIRRTYERVCELYKKTIR